VRSAVLETIATLAPRTKSFVFTHAVSHDGGHRIDQEIAEQILGVAQKRGAETLVVRLFCDEATLAARIEMPSRAARLKERDGARAAQYVSLAPFIPDHDWVLEIETTNLRPEETADAILNTIRSNRT